MSRAIDELREKMKRQFQGDADTVFSAVVTEVDEELFTCTVRRDECVDYFDVRLRGLVNSELQGLAFIPKLESVVLVCRIGKSNELFVAQFTEIEKVCFSSGDLTLDVDSESVAVKKGDNVTILLDGESITCLCDQSTIKITTAGLTLTKGGSGLKKTLGDLLVAIKALTVTTGVGPSGPPINIADFIAIEKDLTNYLEG